MSGTLDSHWGFTDDTPPEEAAKHDLTVWLESYGADVYWEKRNEWDYQTFRVEQEGHATEIPDLVIDFGDDVFAVEAKSGYEKSGVYDARWQVMKYWLKYLQQDCEYLLGDSAVGLDGFLTATKWSTQGHLFHPDYELQLDEQHFGEGRRVAISNGELPPTEYTMTEQHIRNLWRHRKRATTTKTAPSVGALLSAALARDGGDNQPPAVLLAGGKWQDWRVYR